MSIMGTTQLGLFLTVLWSSKQLQLEQHQTGEVKVIEIEIQFSNEIIIDQVDLTQLWDGLSLCLLLFGFLVVFFIKKDTILLSFCS